MPAPIYVTNEDPQFFAIKYEDMGSPTKRAEYEALWKKFNRLDPATGITFNIWYRPSKRGQTVKVDHLLPPSAPAGRYRVETFVPGKHATTRKAVFTVAHNFRTVGGTPQYDDTPAMLDMYNRYDEWVSLGELDLDPASHVWCGRVRQYDMSLEDPPTEIAFGPVRWVPLFAIGSQDSPRYDFPMGTQAERDGPIVPGPVIPGWGPIWVGKWYDATPFCSWYSQGYHTGADLNIQGVSAADMDAPIYAVADGLVTYAGAAGSWGNIIVIEHPDAIVTLADGTVNRQKVHSRYGHVSSNTLVKAGQTVSRGTNIGFVGLARGATTGWHLHFDISHTGLLKTAPSHWPDMSKIRELQKNGVSPNNPEFVKAQQVVKAQVLQHYLDPLQFLKDNHG